METVRVGSTIPKPQLVEALLDPTVYPHRAGTVELVETHISWVFLTDDRVYKIKKPVDLGFLDFTTLERRRFFCEEEVRLNRRLAPDIYLGVVELTGSPHRPRFGGPGEPFEVAVEMLRLPADRMLDHLIEADAADPTLMDEIAHLVARFHADAETGGEIDELGGIDTVRQNWEENFAQTSALPPDLLAPEERKRIRAYVDVFLEREAERFAARVRAGRSRDCHGDLQAQHVCCTRPIRIFDCIEFNHRFRFGDTAGEIAFLAMDVERLGRPDLATRFLSSYLEESGDYDAVAMLDFYRAYRAYVRGKVLGFLVAAHPELAGQARRFFALATGYAKPTRQPRLIATTGVMGSGKTTVARAAALRLNALVVRTDAVRKHLAGVPLDRHALHGFGEGLYTPDMGARTYAESLRTAGLILEAGWPVVVDGSFSTAAERSALRDLAHRMDLPVTVLWCDAPDEVIVSRLNRRAAGPREVSDGRPELLAAHRARYESPKKEPDVVRVDTTGEAEEISENTIKLLLSS